MAMQRRESFLVFYVVALVAVIVAAGAVYLFWSSKQHRIDEEAIARAAQLEQGPSVVVATSSRGPAIRRITLVGEALPYKAATLYAKVGGYLSRIAVDKGDRVRARQFIAEIQSPELEDQYRAAVATLENRQRLEERVKDLAAKGFYSAQALEDAQTNTRVSRDQVSELRAMLAYRTLSAPFSGVVTARYADPGALVTNATSNQSSALPVVTVSDTSRLRVTIYAEQGVAPAVKPGTEVEIEDPADPLRRAKAKVTRTAGALDPKTRTLLTEVEFDNRKGEFIAGSFVNVSLLLPIRSYVEVPVAALVMRDKRSYVAAIGDDTRIRLTPIETAGTDGKFIQIASGLGEGVRVALNLPNNVPDGAKVNPASPPGAAAAAAAQQAKPAAPQPK